MPWYFSSLPLASGRFTLSGEEARHLTRVARKRPGDEVELFDGNGTVAQAVIESLRKDEVVLDIKSAQKSPRPQGLSITLAVGIVSADSLSDSLHSSVPSGIDKFVPLVTERSQWGHRAKDTDKLVERLKRVAVAACKQCECPYLPECVEPATVDELLTAPPWDAIVIASLAPGARDALTVFLELRASCAKSVLLLVGPEGDFTEVEHNLALGKGALPARIDPYILRTEHAACVLTALARNILGAG